MRGKLRLVILASILIASVVPLRAQQKGQYMPGQFGLNAGILPDPGISYVNMEVNYNTSTLNGPDGKRVLNIDANLNLWAIENIFYYVMPQKALGGHFGMAIMFPTAANASLVLESLGVQGQTWGLADTWVQPLTLGWHLKRADIQVGDAIVTPTGRYTPGARNNTGSGYVGNDVFVGTTIYLTKNKGTSINYFGDWEVHGNRKGTYDTTKRPGQAYTQEWGLGQVLPLSKDFSKLIQLGVIGYDQWQLTDNGGTVAVTDAQGNVTIVPASLAPHYSVHAFGGQGSFILPKKNLAFFFKYEHEYESFSHSLGYTMVFGGSYTFKIPKP